jgi:hypothetical protein
MLSTLTKSIKLSPVKIRTKLQARSFSNKLKIATWVESFKEDLESESWFPLAVATTVNVGVSVGLANFGVITPPESLIYSVGSFCFVSSVFEKSPFCGYGLTAYFPLIALSLGMFHISPLAALGIFLVATGILLAVCKKIRFRKAQIQIKM